MSQTMQTVEFAVLTCQEVQRYPGQDSCIEEEQKNSHFRWHAKAHFRKADDKCLQKSQRLAYANTCARGYNSKNKVEVLTNQLHRGTTGNNK